MPSTAARSRPGGYQKPDIITASAIPSGFGETQPGTWAYHEPQFRKYEFHIAVGWM